MSRLLNAGFTRLRKSKLFYLLVVFTIGLALFVNFAMYSDMKTYGKQIEVGQLMLIYATVIGIVIAIFTSLFLGIEYSNGTVRNKIGVGHKRSYIYLSNLLVTVVTGLFSYIVFVAVIACVGIPLFGTIKMSISQLSVLIGCILITVVAYSAIFTFITMIISNNVIASIVSIVLAFGLMMVALICFQIVGISGLS